MLAFLACSDDKSGDGSSAGQLFLEALHSDDVEEDSEDSDPEELDEDSDPEELEEDLDSDENSIDDSDEQDEPSSSSKKKNAVRSSSSADKSRKSSEDSEVNIEPVPPSSPSSASARSSSSSYKNCCADVPSISISPTYSDLWYGDLVAVNTDVYAGEKWKNRDAGLWFTTSDSIDGGESRIIWPVLPGTAYDAASLDPVIEYCYGLCGEYRLDVGPLGYDPFVDVGFFLVGLDSNGKDIALDVSDWEGICIQYTADIASMLLLDLGDSVNKMMENDLPRVKIPKSYAGAGRCYLWSSFEREKKDRGFNITGEQAAKQLVKIIFRLQSNDDSVGTFSIISLGTVKGNK
ncbi:MAG: hypothetical protein J5615_04230 [Fibrobacter sp.]|nr:hypothetical protein [Fibrobacter sp.]